MKMTRARLWVEIVALVTAGACAVALLFALFATAGSVNAGSVNAGSGNAGAENGGAENTDAAKEESAPNQLSQAAAGEQQSYEGIVTDTRCGAKHSAKVGLSAADCTRACLHAGEHFALIDGEKAYTLEGESAALKRVAGERVKVTGSLSGSTISVASVSTAF